MAMDSAAREMSKRVVGWFLIINTMASIHNYTVGILRLLGPAPALGRVDRSHRRVVGQRLIIRLERTELGHEIRFLV